VSSKKNSDATSIGQEVAATPPSACTNACTENAKADNATKLDALASALLSLSPADRAKLAAMLTGTARA
jgi:hypothetical protein